MTRMSRRVLPVLAGMNVLAGMLLVPAARPLLAARFPGADSALHAFFSVNMLGAVVGAPLVSWLADRLGTRRAMAVGLSLLDAALLLACLAPVPLWAVLVLRTLQGAAGVGALSIIMGAGRAASGTSEVEGATAAPFIPSGVEGRPRFGVGQASELARAERGSGHGGAMGSLAAAVVAGIALGAPLGTLLLGGSASFVFAVAAGLAALVAVGCQAVLPPSAPRVARATGVPLAGLKVPALFVGAERFAVGCFVTTFSLYAHQSLGQSDRQVGAGFSVFLLCFALSSWAVGLAAGRLPPRALLPVGAGLFGLGFVVLGFVGQGALWPTLALMGLASGCIYTPSLCLAAQAVPEAQRSTAMGLLNGAGTFGMMLGTALAGILSAALLKHGWSRAEASSLVFALAGCAQWAALAFARAHREERSGTFDTSALKSFES